ncbi:VOC family protein [Streptomyces sp. AC627_RSS907]|uniref:VOC family protein n=1 Tax=Streptomyces sp. AC627_RSS907 TaxID=2823684 RepID=UPI001C215083|nr:VOC family protein [Streptomyces sp. AC627_RSS907]
MTGTTSEGPAAGLPSSFSHTALSVDDMEAAVRRFADVFGVSFTTPMTPVFPYVRDTAGTAQQAVRTCVSLTQEPYFVLVEAQDREADVHARSQVGSLACWGWWEEDTTARLRHLRAQGVGIAATYAAGPDTPPAMIVTERDLCGTRLCYLGAELRNEWAAQVEREHEGGPLPESYYHVGMVVPDIDKAIERCAAVLQVPFTEAAWTESPHQREGDAVHTPFRQQALSRTREPYVALDRLPLTALTAPSVRRTWGGPAYFSDRASASGSNWPVAPWHPQPWAWTPPSA